MDKALQSYYEARFDMCSSQGWRDLLEDVQKMRDATNQVAAIKDEADLHFKRGELSIMNWLLSLEKISEEAYKQLEDA